MIVAPAWSRTMAAIALAAWPTTALASGLQPYQMTRSLQLVQDRIADGDHAALPMQRRLIELTDERLRQAGPEDLADIRNFHALMVYGMSGGNPSTLAAALSRATVDDERNAALAGGVQGYLAGDVAGARDRLATVDIAALPAELGAFAYLVHGSVVAGEDPARAVVQLDRARLLAPGTLIEEAALRRSLALHAQTGEAGRFIRAASQYARRFLRSPYASQFAETLVRGLAAMFEHIDRAAIVEVTSWMSREQEQTIYLRLARHAAIEGRDGLLEFASARARQLSGEEGEDPRGILYSSIASVTSDTVDEVVRQLRRIDRGGLSAADRALLDAAEAIAAEVVAPPEGLPAPAPRMAAATEPTEPAAADATPDDDFGTGALLESARAKLEAIDLMLETPR